MGEKKGTFMQKVQRFGGAMFTPVLFFAVFGIIVGFATLFKNELVFGAIAHPDTTWYKFWDLIYMGANSVFKQMPAVVRDRASGLAGKEAAGQGLPGDLCDLCHLPVSDEHHAPVLGDFLWC